MMPFDTMPLSALVHEPIYARGYELLPRSQRHAERNEGAQPDGQQIV